MSVQIMLALPRLAIIERTQRTFSLFLLRFQVCISIFRLEAAVVLADLRNADALLLWGDEPKRLFADKDTIVPNPSTPFGVATARKGAEAVNRLALTEID